MTTTTHTATVRCTAPSGKASASHAAATTRFSSILATIGRYLSAAGQSLWRGLEAAGHRRAQRILRLTAVHFDGTDPDAAAGLRDAARLNAET